MILFNLFNIYYYSLAVLNISMAISTGITGPLYNEMGPHELTIEFNISVDEGSGTNGLLRGSITFFSSIFENWKSDNSNLFNNEDQQLSTMNKNFYFTFWKFFYLSLTKLL